MQPATLLFSLDAIFLHQNFLLHFLLLMSKFFVYKFNSFSYNAVKFVEKRHRTNFK